MAVHHDTFKSAIASAFENSDIKFSKVSDLSKGKKNLNVFSHQLSRHVLKHKILHSTFAL